MTTPTTPPPAGRAADHVVVPRRGDVALFYAITFAVPWGIAAALVFARPQTEALFGAFGTDHWLFFLAVYTPTLTAVGLTAVRDGADGLRRLGARVFRWRVPLRYYLLVLVGWPVMDYAARLLQWAATGEAQSPAPLAQQAGTLGDPWLLAPLLLLSTLLLDPGPLGEEVGQRGYVLPRVLARRTPLVAALEVGLLWGIWHLPAFAVSGTAQHDLAIGAGWLVLGTVSTSVLMSWISLRTRGGVLVAGVLVHLMVNVSVADVWATALVYTLVAVPAAVSLHRTRPAAAVPTRRRGGRHAGPVGAHGAGRPA